MSISFDKLFTCFNNILFLKTIDWLKNDSDYDSNCSLCETSLGDEDCIRLICYDLFHKKCLNERELQLPLNTSPNGRSCPKCQVSIFPAQNLVSPVAEALKTWLNQTSWGRNEIIDLSNVSNKYNLRHSILLYR